MTDNTAARPGNLKPGKPPSYADVNYWDSRYNFQPAEFDWFYGWSAVRKLVKEFIPKHRPCLHVGCGNSNLQGGMGRSGYQVTNVDISQVVVAQMQQKHRDMPNIEYVCADCRDMPYFKDCSFSSAIDKGTLDALLCSQEGLENVRLMLSEISRVLQPGAVFLEISLGDPTQRLALLCKQEFKWSVSVCLLPRADLQHMVQLPGRTLPTNDTLEPVKFAGPFPVNMKSMQIDGIQTQAKEDFFYAYVCRKEKLVLKNNSPVALPEGWKEAARQAANRLQKQLGLSQDLLAFPHNARSHKHQRRVNRSTGLPTLAGRSQSHVTLAELLMQSGKHAPGFATEAAASQCPQPERTTHPGATLLPLPSTFPGNNNNASTPQPHINGTPSSSSHGPAPGGAPAGARMRASSVPAHLHGMAAGAHALGSGGDSGSASSPKEGGLLPHNSGGCGGGALKAWARGVGSTSSSQGAWDGGLSSSSSSSSSKDVSQHSAAGSSEARGPLRGGPEGPLGRGLSRGSSGEGVEQGSGADKGQGGGGCGEPGRVWEGEAAAATGQGASASAVVQGRAWTARSLDTASPHGQLQRVQSLKLVRFQDQLLHQGANSGGGASTSVAATVARATEPCQTAAAAAIAAEALGAHEQASRPHYCRALTLSSLDDHTLSLGPDGSTNRPPGQACQQAGKERQRSEPLGKLADDLRLQLAGSMEALRNAGSPSHCAWLNGCKQAVGDGGLVLLAE